MNIFTGIERMVAHDLDGVERSQDVYTNEHATFENMVLSEKTLLGLKNSGFKKPSPIQLRALPLGKCGFDLLLEAKSGTGKTAVFGIVALEMLVMNENCQVLIVAPTREIAAQIKYVISSIGAAFQDLKVEVVMGGTSLAADVKRLQNSKYQILVGSPGRLKHLIKQKIISLDTIRLFVLDEADKLMEECFQHDINYMFSLLPQRKQVIVASATYDQKLRDFLSLYMTDPSHICPYSSSILLGLKQFISVVPSHLNTVRQTSLNFQELIHILGDVSFKQCLIFCNYQSRTRTVCEKLCANGWPSEYLAGSQTQDQRLGSLCKLQNFDCRILVATDLVARGIDAANVDLVINFDYPFDVSTYLHRIGRAGRYGSRGNAITIVASNEVPKFISLFNGFVDHFEIKPLRQVSTEVKTETSKFDDKVEDSQKKLLDNSNSIIVSIEKDELKSETKSIHEVLGNPSNEITYKIPTFNSNEPSQSLRKDLSNYKIYDNAHNSSSKVNNFLSESFDDLIKSLRTYKYASNSLLGNNNVPKYLDGSSKETTKMKSSKFVLDRNSNGNNCNSSVNVIKKTSLSDIFDNNITHRSESFSEKITNVHISSEECVPERKVIETNLPDKGLSISSHRNKNIRNSSNIDCVSSGMRKQKPIDSLYNASGKNSYNSTFKNEGYSSNRRFKNDTKNICTENYPRNDKELCNYSHWKFNLLLASEFIQQRVYLDAS